MKKKLKGVKMMVMLKVEIRMIECCGGDSGYDGDGEE